MRFALMHRQGSEILAAGDYDAALGMGHGQNLVITRVLVLITREDDIVAGRLQRARQPHARADVDQQFHAGASTGMGSIVSLATMRLA